MNWSNADTQVLAMYVAGTRSGIQWVVHFLWKAHEDIYNRTYEEEVWVRKFRDAVIKSFPSMFDGVQKIGVPKIDSDVVDWNQFYHHCLDLSKPRPGAFDEIYKD